MTTMQRATFDDLMATPEDGHLYELVRGEILRMPPPQGPHGRVEVRFTHLIESYLDARALAGGWDGTDADVRDRLVGFTIGGEAGVRFSLPDDPDQTRGMDAAYLDPEQAGRYLDAGASGYIREVPALVAEVISPSDRAIYVDEKVADYLAGGARLVWLLDPVRRTVRVHRADGGRSTIAADGVLSGEDVLPGFEVAVAQLIPSTAAKR